MISRVFAIHDKAVQAFNAPFTARTVAEAHRMFAMAVTKDGQFQSNPRDYELFEVGEFDDSVGVVRSDDTVHPRRIVSAAECIAAAAEASSPRPKPEQ